MRITSDWHPLTITGVQRSCMCSKCPKWLNHPIPSHLRSSWWGTQPALWGTGRPRVHPALKGKPRQAGARATPVPAPPTHGLEDLKRDSAAANTGWRRRVTRKSGSKLRSCIINSTRPFEVKHSEVQSATVSQKIFPSFKLMGAWFSMEPNPTLPGFPCHETR